ncbi:MAG: hypothetical protein IJK94_03090 [Bacteroidaceae bacterium]|nr:hypothetical protein [Bacteroidaceae bacterium]
MRNIENPFKFGTIVEEEYFTDRIQEVKYICQFLRSLNHLVLISPRRLQKDGYVIYSDRYEMEDPFFREWIVMNNG